MVGRFKLGLAAGLAIGYVLGTKAGRERYVQMQRTIRQAQRIGNKLASSSLAQTIARKAGAAVGNGLVKGKSVTISRIPWVKDHLGDQQPASSF